MTCASPRSASYRRYLIQSLATVAPHRINNSLIPIVAYNYGAKRRTRIDETLRWARIYGFGFMALGMLVLFPRQILLAFNASEQMLSAGIPAIRMLSAAYFISVFGLTYSAAFQALGQGGYRMMLTLFRQAALPFGFALLFQMAAI